MSSFRQPLASVVALLVAMASNAWAQPQDAPATPLDESGMPQITRTVPLVVAEGDDEMERLLKNRYNAGLAEFKLRLAFWVGGRASLDDCLACLQRYSRAASELSQPADRIAKLELALGAAKFLEPMIRTKIAHGNEPITLGEYAKFVQADVEIELLRARREAKRER